MFKKKKKELFFSSQSLQVVRLPDHVQLRHPETRGGLNSIMF